MNLISKYKTFFLLLIHTILILLLFSYCKLTLNNPNDPRSRSYFETALWNAYLRSLCDPSLRGSVILGSGSYFTAINDLKKIGEDIYFTASVSEPVVWNGRTTGINFSFSGTTPTTNLILVKINGRTFKIDWLDYLGTSNGSYQVPEYASVYSFSNGDVGVSTIVTNTQSGALSSKTADPAPAVYVLRYSTEGNRRWTRYLNKSVNEFNAGNGFVSVSDQLDCIHIFYQTLNSSGTVDTVGFSNMPTPTNQTSGVLNKSEIGWATINGDGSVNSQRFLLGNSGNSFPISINTAVSSGSNLFLGGKSNDEIAGFTGHPFVGNSGSSVFMASLNLDFSISNIRYYGDSSGIGEANLTKMTLDRDRIYALGASSTSFGTPSESFQSGTNDSLLYMRFDLASNLVWHSFLGSNTSGLINDPAILTYEGRTTSITSKVVGGFDGLRYTGHNGISSGNEINLFPSVTARINPENGKYQSLFYETNSDNTIAASITRLRAFRHYQDVCAGRMVTAKNEFLDNGGNIGYIEVFTRPPSQEP
ncbi:hypothetical protein EHQ96_04430 [Leptospira levettii]|uniref:Uncharacterized protein n=1 Tax=Leptospira levettii TaxID=2023178 RepID=A0A5F2D7L4_9LEPT|nr:hypothetical protein [Leptospira levettii]MCW7465897.1 hypothetical protein [Leptospira levettii]MCW7510635.1 hypothetical protein [Leptospira levettii]MCW7514388.1 hypothetical protein [Leptospira levettii]TGM68797.1 hypothetical protein EHQ96_04430 [Leptospira levettii]